MKRQLLPFVILMLSVSLQTGSLQAQEAVEPSGDSREQAEQATDSQTEDEAGEQPDPESLRNREISEAFERFKPSEEISADNAVPFPTDI